MDAMSEDYLSVLITDEFGEEIQVKSLRYFPATKLAEFIQAGNDGDVGGIVLSAIYAARSTKDKIKIEKMTMDELTSFVKNWVQDSGY